MDFLFALGLWLFVICLLDFWVKGNYVSRFERRTEAYNKAHPNSYWMSWGEDAHPFFKDTGSLIKWRNVIFIICVGFILLMLNDKRYAMALHFGSMFPVEFVGYWLWAALLKRWVPQQQYFAMKGGPVAFGGVRRLPNFGEVPAEPIWLPSWYRKLRLHERWVVAFIVGLNGLVALGKTLWL